MAKVKACVQCGDPFVAKHHQQQYCSQECAHRAREKTRAHSADWQFRKQVYRARKARQERLRRLAEQSRETAKITVEEREFRNSELGMVIRRVETRGYCPCTSSLGIRHQYVTDKGVTYIV